MDARSNHGVKSSLYVYTFHDRHGWEKAGFFSHETKDLVDDRNRTRVHLFSCCSKPDPKFSLEEVVSPGVETGLAELEWDNNSHHWFLYTKPTKPIQGQGVRVDFEAIKCLTLELYDPEEEFRLTYYSH